MGLSNLLALLLLLLLPTPALGLPGQGSTLISRPSLLTASSTTQGPDMLLPCPSEELFLPRIHLLYFHQLLLPLVLFSPFCCRSSLLAGEGTDDRTSPDMFPTSLQSWLGLRITTAASAELALLLLLLLLPLLLQTVSWLSVFVVVLVLLPLLPVKSSSSCCLSS
jgi:hypothetical protein